MHLEAGARFHSTSSEITECTSEKGALSETKRYSLIGRFGDSEVAKQARQWRKSRAGSALGPLACFFTRSVLGDLIGLLTFVCAHIMRPKSGGRELFMFKTSSRVRCQGE